MSYSVPSLSIPFFLCNGAAKENEKKNLDIFLLNTGYIIHYTLFIYILLSLIHILFRVCLISIKAYPKTVAIKKGKYKYF